MPKVPLRQGGYYGRMKEPRHRKKENADANEKEVGLSNNLTDRERKQGFMEQFNGKNVRLTLINGTELTGILERTSYNKFDVLLHCDGEKVFLVPKHSVLFMELAGEKSND